MEASPLEMRSIGNEVAAIILYISANPSQDPSLSLRTSIPFPRHSSNLIFHLPRPFLPSYISPHHQTLSPSIFPSTQKSLSPSKLASKLGTTRPQQDQKLILLHIHRPRIHTRPIRRPQCRALILKPATPLQCIQRHHTLEPGRRNALLS